jgi:DNA-directed RNA polymerase specialized sigma54-like protein
MNIEIRNAALEARIQKQLQATGSRNVEEVLLRLLETREQQDRWLLENRDVVNAKTRRGIDQLEQDEGIPEDKLDAYLAKIKEIAERPTLNELRDRLHTRKPVRVDIDTARLVHEERSGR